MLPLLTFSPPALLHQVMKQPFFAYLQDMLTCKRGLYSNSQKMFKNGRHEIKEMLVVYNAFCASFPHLPQLLFYASLKLLLPADILYLEGQ